MIVYVYMDIIAQLYEIHKSTDLHVFSSKAKYEIKNPISLNQNRKQHVSTLALK